MKFEKLEQGSNESIENKYVEYWDEISPVSLSSQKLALPFNDLLMSKLSHL